MKKEQFERFIETQNKINENLAELRKNLEPKITTLNGLNITTMKIDKINDYITSNIYSKEGTIEAINKEYDYRKEYERCSKENDDLLQMVEKYCRYEDKYEVIKIFDEINKNYVVEKVCDE